MAAATVVGGRRVSSTHWVVLPSFEVLAEVGVRQDFAVDFSVVSQIDGLIFAVMGARIEWDVLAPSLDTAVCQVFGRRPFESCSSRLGWYACDFAAMPFVIAMVASHRGSGVFVVPVRPGSRPFFEFSSKFTKSAVGPMSWFDYLMSKQVMVFDLGRGALLRGGVRQSFPFGVQVVVARFGIKGAQWKSAMRQERRHKVEVVPLGPGGLMMDGSQRTHLAVRPHLLPRVSPLAESRRPTVAADVVEGSPPFEVDPAASPLPRLGSNYDLDALLELTSDFPDEEVRGFGMAVAGPGLDVFGGDRTKAVDQPPRKAREGQEHVAWRSCMKEVQLGRMAGPLLAPPQAACRILPVGMVQKNKYERDPSKVTWRMTSDLSALPDRSGRKAGGSVNDLLFTPDFLKAHTSAGQLRDSLAWLFEQFGEGIYVWAVDIPSCFRRNILNPAMWQFCVYRLADPATGDLRFFQDLCTPFGGTFSEWGHTAVLALIDWSIAREGISDVPSYVDNFFGLWHVRAAGLPPSERASRAEALFRRLGIPLHERMVGLPEFKGLGWIWEVSGALGPFMVCMEDKYTYFSCRLAEWVGQARIDYKELESAVGLMLFLAAGFAVGRAHVACLRGQLTKYASAATAAGWRGAFKCALSAQAQGALAFWHEFFGSWDRRCKCVLAMGPVAAYEVLGRVDASTEFGCGGWVWVVGEPIAHYFVHEWTDADRRFAMVQLRESTGCLEAYGMALWAEFCSPMNGARVSGFSSSQMGSARCRRCKKFFRTRRT